MRAITAQRSSYPQDPRSEELDAVPCHRVPLYLLSGSALGTTSAQRALCAALKVTISSKGDEYCRLSVNLTTSVTTLGSYVLEAHSP